MKRLEHLSYKEKLRELELFRLEKVRIMGGNLMDECKCLKGDCRECRTGL